MTDERFNETMQEGEPLLGPVVVDGEHHAARARPITTPQQLSVMFAVACIVDQFGINPVIVLPRAIILCGWFGFPLAIAVFALSIYTAMLLGRCWVIAESVDHTMTTKTRYPYTALVTLAWGKTAGSLINIFLNSAVFTSNIPALVIASQNLQSLDLKLGSYLLNLPYCYWLIILGVASCPLTWLGSPKDLKWISVLSSCAVILCAVLTWVCMFWDNTTAFSYRDVPGFNFQSVAIAYGILAFQVACHPCILAIQADMKNKQDLSRSVLGSFFVTGGLYITTSLIAVFLYGAGVKANLTQGLPNNLALYLDVGLITLQLFLSTIVGGCPLFQDIEDKLCIPKDICWQRCVLRTFLVMLAVLLAEMLPRFDLVMGLLGGLFTGPITFIIPPLLYSKLRSMLPDRLTEEHDCIQSDKTTMQVPKTAIKRFFQKHFFTLEVNLNEGGLSKLEQIVVWIIVFVGVSATVSAVYFSLRGVVWSSKFVPPCLFDVKAAASVIS